jgi:hypothetical protein
LDIGIGWAKISVLAKILAQRKYRYLYQLNQYWSNPIDVFRTDVIQMIEYTRPLTDWTAHVMSVRERSVAVVHALEKDKFVESL